MLYPACYLSENSKNDYFLNTKNYFNSLSRQTVVEKVASVVFLIYAFIQDIVNIAKRPFTRKVAIKSSSNEWKKYVGYTLIAFSGLALYSLKKYFPNMLSNKVNYKKVPLSAGAKGVVDNFRNISNVSARTGLLFGGSFLAVISAIHNLRSKVIGGKSIGEIEAAIKNHQDYIFLSKTRRVKSEHSKWRTNPPFKYLEAKQSLTGGIVFTFKNFSNLIFKLERRVLFRPRKYEKSEQTIDDETKAGIFINVAKRLENIEKCKEILSAEKFSSIVLPKSLSYIYNLNTKETGNKNIPFPILIQERLDFVKDGEYQLTLRKALEDRKVSEETFKEFVKFLLISGFEDVRDDNIFIVQEKDQYKIGIIDFDKLDQAQTAILGTNERHYEHGQGNIKKIPGLLGVIPIDEENQADIYLGWVKKAISELKEVREDLNEIIAEIERGITKEFPSYSSLNNS